jgi:hypothetical protein
MSEIVSVGDNSAPITPDFSTQNDLFILRLTDTELIIGTKGIRAIFLTLFLIQKQ